MAMFRYTRAVVSGVASTLPAAAIRMARPVDQLSVDLEKARLQHQEYVKVRQRVN